MKMKCIGETSAGELVSIYFDIPEQGEIDQGAQPRFFIDCLGLLVAEEAGELPDTFGLLEVDALALLAGEAHDAESADVVADWLESWAQEIREKYGAAPGAS